MNQLIKRFYIAMMLWLNLVIAVSYSTWEHWNILIEKELLFIVPLQYIALALLFLDLFHFLSYTEEAERQ